MATQPVRVEAEIEGWDELEATLRRIAEQINTQEVLEGALMEGAEIVQGALERSAPVLTRQLAGDIHISRRGRVRYSVRIGPGRRGFYGRFHEHGTSRMSARPWMRPAFDAVRAEAERAISDAIWRQVREAAETYGRV